MNTPFLWLLMVLTVGLVVPTWAEPLSHATAQCPFTQDAWVNLSLTPEQEKGVQRIANSVEKGLLVPIYDESRAWDFRYPYAPVGSVSLNQDIAQKRARLAVLLTEPKPSHLAIQQLAREIAIEELTLKETVAAGMTALATVLTPEQHAQLPKCHRLAAL